MPSASWSFPCSPRNPAKAREELRLLSALIPSWKVRGMKWGPRTGAQLEFGRQLRQTAVRGEAEGADVASGERGGRLFNHAAGGPAGAIVAPGEEDPAELRFRRQAESLTDANLCWTARARFGTYKFFGFAAIDTDGFATLTPAGQRFVESAHPGEALLRQLLKWQYPDNQHRGQRWPEDEFAIYPFVATARLIRALGGLSRREIGLFCFTMRRTEDAAATAEAIRQFRERHAHARGRVGKQRVANAARNRPAPLRGVPGQPVQARYAGNERRVAPSSMADYADALVRYFRYTGLFSVRGARIVVASGREQELDELLYRSGGSSRQHEAVPRGTMQLALGEAPPLQLAETRPLFERYHDAAAFYAYYGAAETPHLPWEDADRLRAIALRLDSQVAELREREARSRTGRQVLTGPDLRFTGGEDYEALLHAVEKLRRTKFHLETSLYEAESHTPQRLREALDFYAAIIAREVIDPPTFLEWNTWRVFLALGQAREVVPHLSLDDDLQPLTTAQGNQPDLEIDYGAFAVVSEVTLRSGVDQRQAEARPVTRHILDAQRRYAERGGGRPYPVYGVFVAPRIHPDTATDFFLALKFRVIERQQIAAIPLTLRQFRAALHPFAEGVSFEPSLLQRLLDAFVQAGLHADTGEEWREGIDAALRRWLASLGVERPPLEITAQPLPLPLFGVGM